ncbi:hypothetical protein [Oceanospirillum linum]|uniref:PilZ domain-containing protein n=1 Tax=Oceanospirillum linum TaxID=966 RepID=A0A1T1HGC8_OCELI|nr:hypothetical protein [Oceanospirillum linum]OOV88856.1 hypothetical protein BTA35_0205155 [Oceanospirillum linum]SEG50013.1 hypothetical protein SAMN04489856_11345 [Oleiphilus messinensis]SMP22998.1 hypothetical protein SAMN06264348_104307 [Oceanospirillum linum]
MQKKQPKKPVSVHWKVRLTRVGHKQFLARTLSLSAKHLHIESEYNLKAGEKVKVEVSALHEGVKKVLVVVGLIRSSILLSNGYSYGLDVMIEKISEADQAFIDDYIRARENLIGAR